MPNWCYNEIEISGDKEKMLPIIEILEKSKENGSRNVMTDLIGSDSNYGTDWYNHNINRFGTKWDFSYEDANIQVTTDKDFISMSVETAWSPPENFVDILCKQFGVNGHIYCQEPGCDFAGVIDFNSDGKISEDVLSFLEGIYTHGFGFDEEIDDRIEWWEDDWKSFAETLDFLSEDELEEIKLKFDSVKESNKETLT